MSPDHAVLQKIGCHGRVNVGNFEGDLQDHVYSLYEHGNLVLVVDEHGEQWVSLTRMGQSNLIAHNSSNPPLYTLEELQSHTESV